MLKAATNATRAPRGTKPVSQAFFSALESIPEASRSAVAKAALTMIRDEMKMRKDKLKVTAAKEKEKEKARAAAPAPATPAKAAPAKAAKAKAAPAKRTAKAAPPPPPPPAPTPVSNGAATPKRRGRKPAMETVTDDEE